MYTIGKLVKRFGISRSALLYYDSIGLLEPSGRSASGYRLYCDDDIERLQHIMIYRDAGMPLADIGRMLESDARDSVEILKKRLHDLNRDINRMRTQQQTIVRLLKNNAALKETRVMTKQSWVALLEATGLSDSDMQRWHREFECMAPEAHQDFLESLGIEAEEVREIRAWSAEPGQQSCCGGRGVIPHSRDSSP